MKLVPRPESKIFDSWMPENGRYVAIASYRHCHIQRMANGSYGFNASFEDTPVWCGPEFDSPEEAYLWAKMTGAIGE